MVDRVRCVHIQSQRAFGPWLTLSYNKNQCHAPERMVALQLMDDQVPSIASGFRLGLAL